MPRLAGVPTAAGCDLRAVRPAEGPQECGVDKTKSGALRGAGPLGPCPDQPSSPWGLLTPSLRVRPSTGHTPALLRPWSGHTSSWGAVSDRPSPGSGRASPPWPGPGGHEWVDRHLLGRQHQDPRVRAGPSVSLMWPSRLTDADGQAWGPRCALDCVSGCRSGVSRWGVGGRLVLPTPAALLGPARLLAPGLRPQLAPRGSQGLPSLRFILTVGDSLPPVCSRGYFLSWAGVSFTSRARPRCRPQV